MNRGMIARPGQDTAGLGHSHAPNALLKVITPNHVAGALPLEPQSRHSVDKHITLQVPFI